MNVINPKTQSSLPDFGECSIEFSALPWVEVKSFVREKRVERGNQVIRMVEFQHGFEEDDWCVCGHVGYVTYGQLEVRFSDHSLAAKEGDALWIPAGSAYRHQAIVLSDAVQLILFEAKSPESP
jgi:quercetin dioxygenase-like cupin family protein